MRKLRVCEMCFMGAQKGALVSKEAEAAKVASRVDSKAAEEDPGGVVSRQSRVQGS